jgi:hypothetical protein
MTKVYDEKNASDGATTIGNFFNAMEYRYESLRRPSSETRMKLGVHMAGITYAKMHGHAGAFEVVSPRKRV